MIRRPPRSTLFPTRRSSDLAEHVVRSIAPSIRRVPPDRLIDVVRGDPTVSIVILAMPAAEALDASQDRKSTRLNSSHSQISYAVFCLKKKTSTTQTSPHKTL